MLCAHLFAWHKYFQATPRPLVPHTHKGNMLHFRNNTILIELLSTMRSFTQKTVGGEWNIYWANFWHQCHLGPPNVQHITDWVFIQISDSKVWFSFRSIKSLSVNTWCESVKLITYLIQYSTTRRRRKKNHVIHSHNRTPDVSAFHKSTVIFYSFRRLLVERLLIRSFYLISYLISGWYWPKNPPGSIRS